MTRLLSLLQAVRMLDDEEDSDRKLKEQFKERWNRTPSGKLTENWRGESNKFNMLLEQVGAFGVCDRVCGDWLICAGGLC